VTVVTSAPLSLGLDSSSGESLCKILTTRIRRDDMLSADEFWSAASEVFSERGHLVVGFSEGSEQPELGSMLDNVLGFRPQQPITVFELTDWKDWKEQVEVFNFVRPAWGPGHAGDPNATYYRVRFCAEGTPFLPRAAARIIDFVVLSYLVRVSAWLFGFLLATAAGGTPPRWVLLRMSHHHLLLFFAIVLGSFAYQTICTIAHGSTLGKLLFSLRVLQDDGSPCQPWSALIRELGYFVDVILFGFIGYVAMQRNPQHKRLGDTWAHTVVGKYTKVPQESKRSASRVVLGLMLGTMAHLAVLLLAFLIMMVIKTDTQGEVLNPYRSDFDTKVDSQSTTKTKSGIAVSITAPLPGYRDVPLGGSKVVTAMVTGTGTKENKVKWSVSGFGCSGTSCGEMTNDSYHAPAIMPSSPFVTLTAVSMADPSAIASVTLHIIDSNPSH